MLRALLLLVLLVATPVAAQAPVRPDTLIGWEQNDVRLFRRVYDTDAPAFERAMRAIEFSAVPGFVYAPLALLVGPGDGRRDAARITLAEVLAGGAMYGLKRAVGRRRPYRALGLEARTDLHGDTLSFPSGHAALAFAVATTASLGAPEWYVVVPLTAWAGGVALARVWHGVHYPSDVLAGAALGVGAGVLAHVLLPERDDEVLGAQGVPLVFLRIGL